MRIQFCKPCPHDCLLADCLTKNKPVAGVVLSGSFIQQRSGCGVAEYQVSVSETWLKGEEDENAGTTSTYMRSTRHVIPHVLDISSGSAVYITLDLTAGR